MLSKYGYLPLLIIILLLAVLVSLTCGTRYISLLNLYNDQTSHNFEIVFSIRLPRIINALTIGALLSLAGLMIQNLVKNPLADPYILGLSGATASVQLIVIASGLMLPPWIFMIIGFVAAMSSLLFLIFMSSKRTLNTSHLLLNGVVMAFAYGALMSLILTLSPLASTKPMLFWLMGDLSYTSFSWYPLIVLVLGILWTFQYHKELDLLARGEFFALKSGINVKKMNYILLITTSVFTALAVSMAGTIGFVGLVIPHMARLMVGNRHALLIPLTAVIGALVLLVADTLARSVVAPIQLPVGIFTALLGVPIFLILMRKRA